jgi:hypothetical protein
MVTCVVVAVAVAAVGGDEGLVGSSIESVLSEESSGNADDEGAESADPKHRVVAIVVVGAVLPMRASGPECVAYW